MNDTILSTILQTHAEAANPCGIDYIEGEREERRVTYPALYQRALGLLGWLQGQGVQAGDELIIFLNQNQAFIEMFWACLLGGIIPVPLAVGNSDEHRLKVLRVAALLPKPWLYTSRKHYERLELFAETEHQTGLEAVRERALFIESIESLEQAGTPHPVQPDDIAFIQFSSGSTGDPKGVTLTHRNLLTNIRGIIAAAGFNTENRFLSWMPLTHDMGIIGFHLTPLVLGIEQALMPTDLFVRRPLLWLLKAGEKRADILSSPNFGYKHCLKFFQESKLEGLDLSHVRLIFNGAEPISAALCAEFSNKLAPYGLPERAMFPVYGLAEASLAVSFPPPQAPLQVCYLARGARHSGDMAQFVEADAGMPVVCVGRAIPGCECQIADESGQAYPENTIGHVLIRGDNVTGGYYRNPVASAAARRPEHWLDTGDLGFLTHGQLYITGRAKDLIIINGQNYYPHDLEHLGEQLREIGAGKIAVCSARKADASSEEVLAFVVFKGDAAAFWPLAQQLRQYLSLHSGLELQQVLPIQRLPKTTSGKIQRYALAERYLDGEFDALVKELEALQAATADADAASSLEQILREICESVISGQRIGLEDNLFELGASSLKLAQIHELVEEHYPEQLELSDFFDYPTIKQLAAHLRGKLDS